MMIATLEKEKEVNTEHEVLYIAESVLWAVKEHLLDPRFYTCPLSFC